jgi:hypothetical protein
VPEGTVLKLKTDVSTTVQEGMDILNKQPGQLVDLSKYVKPSMKVNALVNGDKVAAVHWEAALQVKTQPAGGAPVRQ